MNRRAFISLIGGAATAPSLLWPRFAHAQQAAMPMIGHLNPTSPEMDTDRLRGFRQGLKETGFAEGENVAIAYRWADGQYDRLPALVDELVQRKVAVIVVAGTTAAAVAAKAATATIPIVFIAAEDPVKLGLVASLARPGGNATGVNFFSVELVAKRLELVRELIPGAARVAVLINPANVSSALATVKDAEAAAGDIGLQVRVFRASTSGEIDEAFTGLARDKPDALIVGPDPFFSSRRVQLVFLTARHAIPAIFTRRDIAEAGGLISYGANNMDAHRQAGVYAGRILKGAKPADLPVVQSTKFELVINAQTARTLGLAVPPTLIARADEVIE
jgi:putative ABC transport system substrate-binding protein